MKELEHSSMEEETICGFSRRDFLKFCSTLAVGMAYRWAWATRSRKRLQPRSDPGPVAFCPGMHGVHRVPVEGKSPDA